MKKFLLFVGLVIFGLTVANSNSIRHQLNHRAVVPLQDTMAPAWTQGMYWTGMSKGKKLYYKINPKNQVIFGSMNTKTWSAVVGGTWVAKDGKWVKIANKKLVWSADNGTTWTDVPDWTWQDADGNWCKFDAEWNLWTKKGTL